MAILKEIIKCTQYDILTVAPKIGQMYYDVNNRMLYKDYGSNKEQRMRFNAVILHSESERQNNIKPVIGKFYYVEDTNSLWFYDTRWICKIGVNVEYNTYYAGDYLSPVVNIDESITGAYGDKIIDNNGLLGDGSVVIRDNNRILRSQIKCDTVNNQIVYSSFLDDGLLFIPNAHLSHSSLSKSSGTLHLTVEKELPSDTSTELILKGNAYYYGNLNIYGDVYSIKESEGSVNVDASPRSDYELIKFDLKCTKIDETKKILTTYISIKPMSSVEALIHLISVYENDTPSVVKNDMGELIFTNNGTLLHNVILNCIRDCKETDNEFICKYSLDVSNDLSYSSLVSDITLKQNKESADIIAKLSTEWSDVSEVAVTSQKWIKDRLITKRELDNIINNINNNINDLYKKIQ